ncbi:MAG: YjgN family protein [Rhodanobacter sp.]
MHDETLASGMYFPELDVAPTDTADTSKHFDFHGNAKDYFRIWIVNVALSIVTLGIYSAWASVRTRRYMYANTTLAGSPFEYLAKPLPILRGRLLTGAIFAIYVIAGHVSTPLQLGAGVVFAAFMPWRIVKGMMFRARYSAWRGLRFFFTSDYGGAYQWYFVVYILMGIPFALMAFLIIGGHAFVGSLCFLAGIGGLYPWIKGNQQSWMVDHHYFGGKSFRFRGEMSAYFNVYWRAIAVGLGWFLPTIILVGGVGGVIVEMHGHQPFNPRAPSIGFILAIYAAMAPMYLGIWTYTHTRMTNLLYNQARLGLYSFRSSLQYWPMLGLYLTNALAILFSIGLAIPWARIRLARYRAAHLEVIGEGDLNDFVRDAMSHGEVSATGTEMDSMFGIDISL